jgi:hypothetical protein
LLVELILVAVVVETVLLAHLAQLVRGQTVALELLLFAMLAHNAELVELSLLLVVTHITLLLHLAHTQPNQSFKEQSTWHISQK